MKQRHALAVVLTVLTALSCGRDAKLTAPDERAPSAPDLSTASAPAAPTLLGPADAAGLTVPLTISWSAVLDPEALNGGYNWQVSTSPNFATLVLVDATRPNETQDVVSGLANGTYHWRVNAVNAGLETSAWSATRSFTVTGVGPGAPGTPTLLPTQGYSTFHPQEVLRFHWRRVTDAVTYRLEVSSDQSFPAGPETFWNDNIPDTTDAFQWGLGEGTFFARVFAVSADNPETGVRSGASNVIEFSVFYDNPIGPPPVPLSPPNGATLTLPFTLEWAHVPNPQPMGYEVQISPTSDFSTNEAVLGVQLTEPRFLIKQLTSGGKFWRVRSAQGMASPSTVANTDWSSVRTFTLSTAPPTPVSIIPVRAPLYSGDDSFVEVQLTAGVPAGGASVALASSHPGIAPVPPSLAFPGTHALAQFRMVTGEVTSPTAVTLTATLNGVSTSNEFTLHPPTVAWLRTPTPRLTGGMSIGTTLMLNGIAPSGGATVTFSSNSAAAAPPTTVHIPAGGRSAPLSIPTSEVTASTPVVISASWNGGTVEMPVTLYPSPVPGSLTLIATTVVGGGTGTTARPTLAEPAGFDQMLRVTSSNPAVLPSLPSSVIIMAGSGIGDFPVRPAAVSTTTVVTISVTGGGVTRTADLTVTPADAPRLTSFSVNPTSVAGGATATGTVTLSRVAPAGGTVVSLSSRLPNTAAVPASVTVPAGATSASFPVTTQSTAFTTTVELSATLDDTFLFTSITVGPAAPPQAPSLISPADGAKPAQPVTFDWSDVSGAASYTLEIDDSDGFSAPLVASETVTASAATLSGLPARRLWWRVSARNASGVQGPYSSTRRVEPGPATAAPTLSSIALSPTSLIGGGTSQGTATLSAAAPSGGLLISLSSGSAAASVPAAVTVPAGASSASFAVSTTSVTTSTSATITATAGGVSRTATLTVNPESTSLGAPSLVSPARDARFSPGQSITFDWSDVSGAESYTIEIDDSEQFSGEPVLTQTVTVSLFTTSTLPTRRMWWRVRAHSASGASGSWSSARRFEVK